MNECNMQQIEVKIFVKNLIFNLYSFPEDILL